LVLLQLFTGSGGIIRERIWIVEKENWPMNETREWNAELQQCRLDLDMKRKREARLDKLDKDIGLQQQLIERYRADAK
jgi:hypothetical protein